MNNGLNIFQRSHHKQSLVSIWTCSCGIHWWVLKTSNSCVFHLDTLIWKETSMFLDSFLFLVETFCWLARFGPFLCRFYINVSFFVLHFGHLWCSFYGPQLHKWILLITWISFCWSFRTLSDFLRRYSRLIVALVINLGWLHRDFFVMFSWHHHHSSYENINTTVPLWKHIYIRTYPCF